MRKFFLEWAEWFIKVFVIFIIAIVIIVLGVLITTVTNPVFGALFMAVGLISFFITLLEYN